MCYKILYRNVKKIQIGAFTFFWPPALVRAFSKTFPIPMKCLRTTQKKSKSQQGALIPDLLQDLLEINIDLSGSKQRDSAF